MLNEKTILEVAIIDTINEFKKSRFNFLYERDIQSFLYYKLYEKFLNVENNFYIDGGSLCNEVKGDIKIGAVQCEYPDPQRFDISIIDYNIKIRKLNWYTELWKLPLKFAIEIKYGLLGYGYNYYGLKEDILRLKEYKRNNKKFIGIALLFVQYRHDEKKIEKHLDTDSIESIEDLRIENDINAFIIFDKRIFRIKREFILKDIT